MRKDKRKVSIYIPEALADELKMVQEAYGVNLSRVLQGAWQVAKVYSGGPVVGTIFPLHKEIARKLKR